MKTLTKVTALSVGFFLIASAAMAQTRCNSRDGMLKYLAEQFKEVPIARGLTTEGPVLEVFTDAEGETWTIVVTDAQGVSCAVATGTDWGRVEPVVTGPDA
jgi:hypothetical protein